MSPPITPYSIDPCFWNILHFPLCFSLLFLAALFSFTCHLDLEDWEILSNEYRDKIIAYRHRKLNYRIVIIIFPSFFFFFFFQQIYARETSVSGKQYGKYLARFHACRHDLQICLLYHFRGRRGKSETYDNSRILVFLWHCWSNDDRFAFSSYFSYFVSLITGELDNKFLNLSILSTKWILMMKCSYGIFEFIGIILAN